MTQGTNDAGATTGATIKTTDLPAWKRWLIGRLLGPRHDLVVIERHPDPLEHTLRLVGLAIGWKSFTDQRDALLAEEARAAGASERMVPPEVGRALVAALRTGRTVH